MSWGYGAVSQGTANVGTSTGAVVAANSSRKYLRLQNDGTVDVYLSLGTAAATLNTGIRLASGGAYEMNPGYGNVWSGAIQGIATVGGTRVMYVEGQ